VHSPLTLLLTGCSPVFFFSLSSSISWPAKVHVPYGQHPAQESSSATSLPAGCTRLTRVFWMAVQIRHNMPLVRRSVFSPKKEIKYPSTVCFRCFYQFCTVLKKSHYCQIQVMQKSGCQRSSPWQSWPVKRLEAIQKIISRFYHKYALTHSATINIHVSCFKQRFSLVTCGSSAGNTFRAHPAARSNTVKKENSNTKELIDCRDLVHVTKDSHSKCAHLCPLLISLVPNTLSYTDNPVISCGKKNHYTLYNSKVISFSNQEQKIQISL